MSKTRGHRKCAKARCSLCNQAELNRLKFLKATGEKKR